MAEDRRRGDDMEDGGPGLAFMPFVVMDELMDKLILLEFDRDFIKRMNTKPISRHYFAKQTNPGEQFFMFTSLSAWLLRTAGRPFDQPQEYDDPNATISSILEEVRRFKYTIDFSPSKLKQGCGEHCLFVLDRLADEALRHKNFTWRRPQYPEEEAGQEDVIEDDGDMDIEENKKSAFPGQGNDGEIDEQNDDDFDEDEPMMDLEGLKRLSQKQSDESSKPEEIMESKTDAVEWKLEVERVLPQLKVAVRAEQKDWRDRVDNMHQYKVGIDGSLQETKSYLDKLYDEITRTLEKITSREKYINNQLEHTLHEFRSLQDHLAETKERYRQASGGVTDRSRLLAEVSEELEKVKMEMEERGSSMTDGAPLVKIKQSIQQLKKENTQMDIRIGVVEHILLQGKLKDKASQNKQVHSGQVNV